MQIELTNYDHLVFYPAPALWDSFPNIVLLQSIVYGIVVISFLEKKVSKYDTEGNRDKKNHPPIFRSTSL